MDEIGDELVDYFSNNWQQYPEMVYDAAQRKRDRSMYRATHRGVDVKRRDHRVRKKMRYPPGYPQWRKKPHGLDDMPVWEELVPEAEEESQFNSDPEMNSVANGTKNSKVRRKRLRSVSVFKRGTVYDYLKPKYCGKVNIQDFATVTSPANRCSNGFFFPFTRDVLEDMRAKSTDYANLLTSASQLSLYPAAFALSFLQIGRHGLDIDYMRQCFEYYNLSNAPALVEMYVCTVKHPTDNDVEKLWQFDVGVAGAGSGMYDVDRSTVAPTTTTVSNLVASQDNDITFKETVPNDKRNHFFNRFFRVLYKESIIIAPANRHMFRVEGPRGNLPCCKYLWPTEYYKYVSVPGNTPYIYNRASVTPQGTYMNRYPGEKFLIFRQRGTEVASDGSSAAFGFSPTSLQVRSYLEFSIRPYLPNQVAQVHNAQPASFTGTNALLLDEDDGTNLRFNDAMDDTLTQTNL